MEQERFYKGLEAGEVSMELLDSALAEQPAPCSVKHSVELVNDELWKEFHQHTNEMIITKAGRRMFPLIQLILQGLDPKSTYYLLLALRVQDSSLRWRFLNGEWVGTDPVVRGVASKAGPREGSVYMHPISPATGSEWLTQNPVGFSKMKLSNKDTEGGKVKLTSLHRYQPVAYLVRIPPKGTGDQTTNGTTEACSLEISEHELSETQFIAVTAYQNDMITQIKIKHNPFAKAFLNNPDKTPTTREKPKPVAEHEQTTPHEDPPSRVPQPSQQTEHERLSWSEFMHQAQAATAMYPYHGGGYYGDARYPHPHYAEYYESYPPVMPYHN